MKIEQSLWKTGKYDNKKFYAIKLGRKTSTLSFLLGILFTAIIILPIACLLFEVVELYWYKPNTMFVFLSVAWALLMICNGLSNYFTVKICKKAASDIQNLQDINENAILLYQTLNPGFGIFILAILIFFGVSAI